MLGTEINEDLADCSDEASIYPEILIKLWLEHRETATKNGKACSRVVMLLQH
jgi:hypothetical protein